MPHRGNRNSPRRRPPPRFGLVDPPCANPDGARIARLRSKPTAGSAGCVLWSTQATAREGVGAPSIAGVSRLRQLSWTYPGRIHPRAASRGTLKQRQDKLRVGFAANAGRLKLLAWRLQNSFRRGSRIRHRPGRCQPWSLSRKPPIARVEIDSRIESGGELGCQSLSKARDRSLEATRG